MTESPEEVRAFIAIELPDEVRRGLAGLRKEMQRDEHRFVKWVDPEAIHLTLKFLGDVPSGRVTEIARTIEVAAKAVTPFELEVSGLGVFPNSKQVRVLWVGIGGDVDRLKELQRGIDTELAALSFAREDRPFVPHLTLARVRQGASPSERRSLGELAKTAVFDDRYEAKVETVSLMRSELTPAGAIYSRLAEVVLGR
jgi:RNA 2',3'-cyclic 3'-phosphodiesterase